MMKSVFLTISLLYLHCILLFKQVKFQADSSIDTVRATKQSKQQHKQAVSTMQISTTM
jgi:hypothetical protein